MRNLFLLTVLLAASSLLNGQHVNDDSVSYTPIPKPGEERPLKGSSTGETILPGRKSAYYLSLNIGSLFGCGNCLEASGVSSSFSAVNGITIGKKIRTGIGAGFDSYFGWNAIPVMASVSWDMWGNRNTGAFFLQVNYGYAKAWMPSSMEGYGFDHVEGGRMLSPQIGYRLKYHGINLSFMTGVKLQRVFSHYRYPTWNWVNGEYQPGFNTSVVEENMSRLMMSLAIGWK